MEKRGLILMVGATGSGKSTTLASMLDHRNELITGHILTFEDPIEFLFNNKKSIVNQREVGTRRTHVADGAEERAAPGARRHPDRRDPRPRHDERGDRLCAVGPPGGRHAAREQQLPRAEPHDQLLPAGSAPGAAPGPVGRDEGHRLAAPGALEERRPRAGGRSAAEHAANRRADRARRRPAIKEAMEQSLAPESNRSSRACTR